MKPKKSLQVPKPQSTQKMWIIVGVALFLLIFFVILYSSYRVGPGKAIEVTEGQIFPMQANLVTNDALILTKPFLDSLQKGDKVIVKPFKTSVSPSNAFSDTFTLTKIEGSLYNISIEAHPWSINLDVIDTSENDNTFFYLRSDDLLPDLQISSQEGKIIVKNLHFISPALSTIEFKTILGSDYPFIIRVPLGGLVNATLKAGSSSFPTLSVNIGSLSDKVDNHTYNYTTAKFNYTAPSTAGPQVLNINSVVGTQKTNAYYLLAVDNVVFDQPGVRVLLTESRGNKASMTFTFAVNAALQPFGLPCSLTDASVESLLGGIGNSRVYTYDSTKKTTLLWHQDTSIPDDFASFDLWKGYYLQFDNPLAPVTLATSCTIPEIISLKDSPLSARNNTQLLQKNLPVGWNLIALPGVVPQPLTSFTDDTQFKLYECNYNGASCQEISAVTPLIPGKPYWVYTTAGINLRYGLK